jgi:antitoxin (DNA-binding transcriptional repressor) of toxin-antitoxin stability system
MKTIELDDLRADPVRFIRELESGEDFVVVDHSRTVAEVHAIVAPTATRRPFGLAAGKIQIADDFDAPLPDEILRDFGEL